MNCHSTVLYVHCKAKRNGRRYRAVATDSPTCVSLAAQLTVIEHPVFFCCRSSVQTHKCLYKRIINESLAPLVAHDDAITEIIYDCLEVCFFSSLIQDQQRQTCEPVHLGSCYIVHTPHLAMQEEKIMNSNGSFSFCNV